MFDLGRQLTPEQRLSKAVVNIMSKAYALAGVIMIGDRAVEHDSVKVPTACTNGRDEWYNKEYIENLSDAELRGLFKDLGLDVIDYFQQPSMIGTEEIWMGYVLEKAGH